MASTNCIYKSVTMQAGETFVLPPGAVLISASSANVTSSCGDIPIVEQKCWKIRWVLNKDPEGAIVYFSSLIGLPQTVIIPSKNNAWDPEDGTPVTVENIGVGGTIASVGSIDCSNLAALEAFINASSFNGALIDRKYLMGEQVEAPTLGEQLEWGNRFKSGYYYYELYFKAVEEVAKTVYIELGSTDNNIADIPRLYARELDCEDYPLVSAVPTC